MSCSGVNCGCGANCRCGSECDGRKMYPGMAEERSTSTQTASVGGASQQKENVDGLETTANRAENGGCKCGPNCSCNPCHCK